LFAVRRDRETWLGQQRKVASFPVSGHPATGLTWAICEQEPGANDE